MHLDRGARTAGRGVAGRRLGQRGGGPSRRGCGVAVAEAGGRRVGEAAGAFQADVVVGQRVLDPLECADRRAELTSRLRVLDGAVQGSARHADQVGGRRHQGCRQRRFDVDRRDYQWLGVDLDVGHRLRGVGGLACHDASPRRRSGRPRPPPRRRIVGQRDDQLRARQVGDRDRASAQPSLAQRHRCSRAAGIPGECAASVATTPPAMSASTGVDGRPGGTQHARGQSDAAEATESARLPRRTPRERASARPGPNSPSASGVASSVQPRSTTVFHSGRHRSGSVIAWRAASGGHSVRRMSRTVSRSDSCSEVQSDIHKSPNIAKIVN